MMGNLDGQAWLLMATGVSDVEMPESFEWSVSSIKSHLKTAC
jgi:hypothetical protein